MEIGNSEIYGVIYLIRNTLNNKVYIGQTINCFDERYHNNIEKYTHNEHLKKAIHKYGIENFEINKEFDIAYSKKELDKLEDMYIKIYNTTNFKYGYNKKGGGANGVPSDETKNKLSKRSKEMWQDENHIENMRILNTGENNPMYGTHRIGDLNPNYGNKWTDKQKSHLSKIRKEKFARGELTAYMKGKKHTEETKKKLSKTRKEKIDNGEIIPFMLGKHHSEETKKKLSEAHKGNTSAKTRKIICLDDLKIFNTITEASKFYNCSIGNITGVCKGRAKHTKQHHFMYHEDYIKQNQLLIHNENLRQVI